MKLFDLHCDTLYECCETGKRLRENDLHINRAAARRYDHYAQFFALFCGARAPSEQSAKGRSCLLDTPPDERLARMLQTAEREFAENADWLCFCKSADDLRAAAENGKAAAFLSIEGAELLPDRADALDTAYAAGVRLVTLTWNYRSRYGCSAVVDQTEGLTPAGRALVRACADKGVLVDVSHLSEQGFWDVCETIDGPFVASHSDSRALRGHPRNLTDKQFAEIVRRGGLAGVNLYTPFLVRQSDSVIDDAIDHIEHFLGLYGESALALGCDLDGCEQLPAGIDGLGDLYRLADRMLALGYKESTVNGLFYDNAFAFIQRML
ncbi:MAG: membrane dipeptidase [Eubacteriales bacterium]|nr:membrane dipeptidase [Eubacteriales bacterium]